ncbi:MAG: hypothetical protein M1816_007348 [Peltula sp. TS41687]|nr:MAG: hypothetical protein M1816_007348 [Peltula sp. TS41687]
MSTEETSGKETTGKETSGKETSNEETSGVVFPLPLTDDGAPNVPGEYIYLPPPTDPPYVVRFYIEGTSSICRQGSLWINIPAPGREFVREWFREFELHPDFNRNIELSIPITSAGAFAFYTTFTPLPEFALGPVPTPQPTRTRTYYIDVCPRLTLQNELLPLNALSIFSIIHKFMGKFPEDFDKHLESIGRLGYNMIHFTPLMHRGRSDSPYSIYDQLQFDPECFPNGEQDIADLVMRMEKEYGLLALIDVVWNHTANNSHWLQDHPEAGYNIETAPWLQSALELEEALQSFSDNLSDLGLPTTLEMEQDLQKVVDRIKPEVIDKIKLWEFYVINVKRDAQLAVDAWSEGRFKFPEGGFGEVGVGGLDSVKSWSLKEKADFLCEKALRGNDRMGERFRRNVDAEVAAALITALFGRYSDSSSKDAVFSTIKSILDKLNAPLYAEFDEDSIAIPTQVFGRAKYLRLDEDGPRRGPITKQSRLIETYFTKLPSNEKTKKHKIGSLALANNGWVWNADALSNTAGPTSKAYLRRELIVWSDCVKLRYGSGPEENPWLWDYMSRYTRLMAKYFIGFRIDNCHSTPLVVAEYLLDQGRKVRSDLYVCAELFTGSEKTDYVFVERLGISSLIREAMQAWSTAELSRLVHMHGGKPIGSFDIGKSAGLDSFAPVRVTASKDRMTETYRRINETSVHALFTDCTHDNQVPAQKRDARDTLPNAALVYMCSCATGSVMGYDDIYPLGVDIVKNKRQYMLPEGDEDQVDSVGIRKIRKLLNELHALMGKDGYIETFIHHEGEYITVHRVHPQSRKGYFLIAHTAFPGYGAGNNNLTPVHLSGTKVELVGTWTLEVDASDEAKKKALSDENVLGGLPSQILSQENVAIDMKSDETVISLNGSFPPGSIAIFKTWIPGAEHAVGLDTFVTTGANEAFGTLNLHDLNFVLYRSEPEERDSSRGRDGVYVVPDYGPLVYAGLQGWWSVLKGVIKGNRLGHPLCRHLREGQWALDSIVGRMDRVSKEWANDRLQAPTRWLRERMDAIRSVPTSLLPRYFALVIQTAYNAAFQRGVSLMSEEVRNGPRFFQDLAMVSVQQTGHTRSASLYPTESVPCLAAGLPHFTTDWSRCWGRDVFLSMRGLYLCTGRYDDAKQHLLAFASVLKHGMIPNLLSSGKAPRYNSRDSIWFFLQGIQEYTKIAPNGLKILGETIRRRFLPYDDTWFSHDDPRAYSQTSTIEDIIQEALQRHATGLSFQEANAGPQLDMQMRHEGFQIDVKVDWDTGLIFGGNQNNCGTWQDKMGESDKAGNKGVPGTPRDGAAVEITGLCYSTLKWLGELSKQGKYSYNSVRTSGGEEVTFTQWKTKLQDNFERCYYIPLDEGDDSSYDVNSKIVNRRGIYKDLYRSGKEYEDYQLRANFPIAMCVAPELFDPEKARHALLIADTVLRGPVGMATLDPSDRKYRPYYNNADDSTDFETAKGRNYHQGPEWVWPLGYFLRAFLHFDLMRRKTKEGRIESCQQITRRLKGCKKALETSPWAGLTELTNKNGELCSDSVSFPALTPIIVDLFETLSDIL